MTDQNEQPQSWRDRLFGSDADRAPEDAAQAASEDVAAEPAEPAEVTPEAASNTDDQRAWQAAFDDDSDRTDEYRPTSASAPAPEAEVEPQVVLPSSLRGDNPTGELDQVDEPSPELVEPARPQLSLRRRERAIEDAKEAERAVMGDEAVEPDTSTQPQADTPAEPTADDLTQEQPVAVEEMPTQAMDPVVAEPAAPTRVIDEPPIAEQEERFFVERPEEPRKRGARGVGFSIALLSTVVFAGLLGLAYLGVTYLFTLDFDPAAFVTVWLSPPLVFAVVAFFIAYLLLTLIVNRAGWWAHVLGGFLVALVTYAAAVWGFVYVTGGGWETGFDGLFSFGREAVAGTVVTPWVIAAFILAREVPIWLGGIVAKRGRTQRRRYQAEMAEYERKLDADAE